jgi:hypothetical protein
MQTQMQAIEWIAQQLQYCAQQDAIDTAEELCIVLQAVIDADSDYANIIQSVHYSNDEVRESVY